MNGLDLLGATVTDPGYVDAAVKEFSANLGATPITYEVARRIALRAVDMTNRAEQIAKSQGSATLIGPAMYEVPRGHALWHLAAISNDLRGRDPKATPYEHFDDLRKWAAGCYRVFMAASQDAQLREMVSKEFWSDVRDAAEAAPAKVIAFIKGIPGGLVEAGTGLPLWAWSLMAIGGVGFLGFVGYKVLILAAPVAVGRYLPARRS